MAKSLVTAFVFVLCAVVIFAQEASQTKWEYFKEKLDCGKESPGSDKSKCHKYGTDSGFKCCWMKLEGSDTEKEMCKLVSYGEVDEIGVSGKEGQKIEFGDQSISLACGSSYIKLISTSVIIALVSLIMF